MDFLKLKLGIFPPDPSISRLSEANSQCLSLKISNLLQLSQLLLVKIYGFLLLNSHSGPLTVYPTVDGPAKSKSPVDRWFIPSHYLILFIGFQPSQIGGAGFLPSTVDSLASSVAFCEFWALLLRVLRQNLRWLQLGFGQLNHALCGGPGGRVKTPLREIKNHEE